MNFKTLIAMGLTVFTLSANANENPFLNYKNWKTPHGTYPFNEIYYSNKENIFKNNSN